jgi:hypothetical protein
MFTERTIIWRRLDTPGHESARLFLLASNWHLSGTAVFAHELQPCRLDYLIQCDSQWRTLSGKVTGWLGNKIIDIEVLVDSNRRWSLNGEGCAEVNGCIDMDLNFSPLTNLLPIRRLNLAVGQEATVTAAWLRFPGFRFEPLDQLYRRVGTSLYHYESAGGSFVAELEVDDVGFVTSYGDLWRVENSG